MRPKMILAGAILGSLAATAGVTGALADNNPNDEAAEMQLITGAKITAADAAKAVADKGVVSSVKIEDFSGKPVFHVEVVSGGQQHDFAVDATTGGVTPMAASANEAAEGPGEASGEDQD